MGMQVIFHVGPHKTGTTAIQSFLQSNRAQLIESGVYVPRSSTDSPGNHEIPWLLRGWDLGLIGATDNTITLENYVGRTLDTAVAGGCDSVLLSSEAFSLLDLGQWKDVLAAFHAQSTSSEHTSFRVVSYLRDPDEYIRSQYKTLVLLGLPDEFDEVRESLRSHFRAAHELIRSLPNELDGISDVMELDYVGHGLVREFCTALFPDTIFHIDEVHEARVNESFDSLAVEVMRQGNALTGLVFERNRLLDWPAFHTGRSAQDLAERRHKLNSAYEVSKSERDALLAERDAFLFERDALLAERDALFAERDALLESKSWKSTKPLRDFARFFRSKTKD
jgi:hypothetical protein